MGSQLVTLGKLPFTGEYFINGVTATAKLPTLVGKLHLTYVVVGFGETSGSYVDCSAY